MCIYYLYEPKDIKNEKISERDTISVDPLNYKMKKKTIRENPSSERRRYKL